MLLARRYSARANVRCNTKNTLTESCGQNARPGLGQGLRCLFFFPQFVLLQFLKLRNGRMLWFLRTSGFFFPKIGVCFSNLRQFPKLLKLEFVEYTPTARDTEGSLSENRISQCCRLILLQTVWSKWSQSRTGNSQPILFGRQGIEFSFTIKITTTLRTILRKQTNQKFAWRSSWNCG